MDKKIDNLKEIKKVLNNNFSKQKNPSNLENFNDRFLILLNIIIKNNDRFFLGIIANYFNFVMPYVNYSLNDKNLEDKNLEDKLIQIEIIFSRQTRELINTYESYLEYIKKGIR